MNTVIFTALISIAIGVLSILTKPNNKQKNSSESGTSHVLRISVIAFVCIYCGTLLLNAQNTPEISIGEPDF